MLGRGHAERLVPMIADLPEKGRADTILVSLGPGSFTGVRIGIATARALGFAWQAEVLGYPTLALVAAMARSDNAQAPVTVCMNGGHGEWFVQDFDAAGMPQAQVASLAPEAAAARDFHAIVAGDRAAELVGDAPDAKHRAVAILPDARPRADLRPRTRRDAIRHRGGGPMTDAELDAIMRIMDSAFDPQWGEAWTRNQVSSALMLSNTHATLIAADGEDLRDPAEAEGFANVRAAPGEEEILLIAVNPPVRRKGLGARLIASLAADARQRGAERLFLEMRENNPARTLYEAQGFVPIGRRKNYYSLGDGARMDAITFGLELSAQ